VTFVNLIYTTPQTEARFLGANINAIMSLSLHPVPNVISSIIRPKPNYSLAIRTWSWGSECSYSRMLTTQRMQSPAFMSLKAWLILSSGWR
jgi:hypothetical protein